MIPGEPGRAAGITLTLRRKNAGLEGISSPVGIFVWPTSERELARLPMAA